MSPPDTDEIRFEIPVANVSNPRDLTVSPDGRTIVFSVATETGTALFVRRSDSTALEQLPGTEGAQFPFWSPDSRNIAFPADD